MSAPLGIYATNVQYKLPATVKALQDSWLFTLQCSAIITALFVVAETLLLPLVKAAAANATLGVSDHIAHALLVLTYATILLGMSSAMSSLILIDEFGSITLRASRSQSNIQIDIYDGTSTNLLTRFNGGRGAWKLLVGHWLFTVLLGYLCLVSQLVLYAWYTEGIVVRYSALAVGIVAVLPLSRLILPAALLERLILPCNDSNATLQTPINTAEAQMMEEGRFGGTHEGTL